MTRPAGAAAVSPVAVERTYLRFIGAYGIRRTSARRYEPVPPISGDGVTDCWTHAWTHAAEFGLRYVEGVCMKRPGVLATHAWCESGTALGSVIVELTEGFGAASDYVGLAIDLDPTGLPVTLTADWPSSEPRSSVLQAAIGGGFPPAELLTLTTEGVLQ